MLELIFVIIILGIVASIGAEIIANVYSGYILQRAQHRASIKTELAATQIANRLAYAIPGSVVRKTGIGTGGTNITEPGSSTDQTLQWVGADADSFKAITTAANRLPGWSGFCDVDASTTTSISTPGSNLSLVDTIRTNLGLTAASPKIYFPSESALVSGTVDTSTLSGTTLGLSTATPRIVEHYKLATTSYALVVSNTGDLTLHYNFTPQRDIAVSGLSQLLLRNVSTFEFRGDGRTIRFKICVDEKIGDTNPITICKEKAVF